VFSRKRQASFVLSCGEYQQKARPEERNMVRDWYKYLKSGPIENLGVNSD
jgi:hypothetical protein